MAIKVETTDDGVFRLISTDGFPMTSAGAGEQQLMVMLAAMGPRSIEDAQAWMEAFIPSKGDG